MLWSHQDPGPALHGPWGGRQRACGTGQLGLSQPSCLHPSPRSRWSPWQRFWSLDAPQRAPGIPAVTSGLMVLSAVTSAACCSDPRASFQGWRPVFSPASFSPRNLSLCMVCGAHVGKQNSVAGSVPAGEASGCRHPPVQPTSARCGSALIRLRTILKATLGASRKGIREHWTRGKKVNCSDAGNRSLKSDVLYFFAFSKIQEKN